MKSKNLAILMIVVVAIGIVTIGVGSLYLASGGGDERHPWLAIACGIVIASYFALVVYYSSQSRTFLKQFAIQLSLYLTLILVLVAGSLIDISRIHSSGEGGLSEAMMTGFIVLWVACACLIATLATLVTDRVMSRGATTLKRKPLSYVFRVIFALVVAMVSMGILIQTSVH